MATTVNTSTGPQVFTGLLDLIEKNIAENDLVYILTEIDTWTGPSEFVRQEAGSGS
jgi:hypothetical protein